MTMFEDSGAEKLQRKSTKRRIAAALTSLLWGLFTYIGYDLVSGVSQRHVPGYPSAARWHYYVHFPAGMLLVNVSLLLLARSVLPTASIALVGQRLHIGHQTQESLPRLLPRDHVRRVLKPDTLFVRCMHGLEPCGGWF